MKTRLFIAATILCTASIAQPIVSGSIGITDNINSVAQIDAGIQHQDIVAYGDYRIFFGGGLLQAVGIKGGYTFTRNKYRSSRFESPCAIMIGGYQHWYSSEGKSIARRSIGGGIRWGLNDIAFLDAWYSQSYFQITTGITLQRKK